MRYPLFLIAFGLALCLAALSPRLSRGDSKGSSMGAIDTATTFRVRRTIMKDDSLSIEAKNVNITTRNGKVTLTGKVHRPEEEQILLSCATYAVGEGNVIDRIEVEKKEE